VALTAVCAFLAAALLVMFGSRTATFLYRFMPVASYSSASPQNSAPHDASKADEHASSHIVHPEDHAEASELHGSTTRKETAPETVVGAEQQGEVKVSLPNAETGQPRLEPRSVITDAERQQESMRRYDAAEPPQEQLVSSSPERDQSFPTEP